MKCENCGNAKTNSKQSVFCLLFGISIRKGHEGCRYHKGKEDVGYDTVKHRDGMDDPAEKAAG